MLTADSAQALAVQDVVVGGGTGSASYPSIPNLNQVCLRSELEREHGHPGGFRLLGVSSVLGSFLHLNQEVLEVPQQILLLQRCLVVHYAVLAIHGCLVQVLHELGSVLLERALLLLLLHLDGLMRMMVLRRVNGVLLLLKEQSVGEALGILGRWRSG